MVGGRVNDQNNQKRIKNRLIEIGRERGTKHFIVLFVRTVSLEVSKNTYRLAVFGCGCGGGPPPDDPRALPLAN